MTSSNAARQRRHRHHRRGDHSLCLTATCASAGNVQAIPPLPATDGPQFLYRLFDATGKLLYVGVTGNIGQRLKAHRLEQPWWPQVARMEVERYPDRASVEQAERDAIRLERPVWNVMHNAQRAVAPSTGAPAPKSRIRIVRDGVEIELESAGDVESLMMAAVKAWRDIRDG